MKALVLSINYAPEPTGFAPHVTALCQHLAKSGHEVTVFTGFPFAPRWKRRPEDRGKLVVRELCSGVNVVRLSHYIPRKAGRFLPRIAMEATFSIMAVLRFLLRYHRPDVILYVGAQPSIAMTARLLSRLSGAPYAVAINDLAAEAASDVGIVDGRRVLRFLKWFEYSAYKGASRAIVLCSAFKESLEQNGFPPEKVAVIGSPIDLQLVRPLTRNGKFRDRLGIPPQAFVVLYAGSMGIKQGLMNVIEAAALLRQQNTDVVWVLVGEGEVRAALEDSINRRGLSDAVRIAPLQPEELMSEMFSAADVLLLNQVSAMKKTVIPSKLLTYMAAGRAVIAAVSPESQGAALLQDSRGGFLVEPDDPAALAAAVARVQRDRSGIEEMGHRNRAFVERYYDQNKVLAAQTEVLLNIVSEHATNRQ